MRILVTGSRNWTDEQSVTMGIYSLGLLVVEWSEITIVHGGAQGADTIADRVARTFGAQREIHRPDYKTGDPKTAPLRRNDLMLDSGIALVLAFMLGAPERGGTLYTVNGAKKRGIPVVLYNWPGDAAYKG